MAGKLLMLFKDKEISYEHFDHLADVVIFNQYSVAPGKDEKHVKVIEFDANTEEINRLRWFVQFSGLEVMYVLDRELEVRERLKDSGGQLGGDLKIFDIVLVQLGDKIHCIRNAGEGGGKTSLRFALASNAICGVPTDDPGATVEVIEQAKYMRESLIQQLGMVCENCGFDQMPALDLYEKKYFYEESILAPIPMVQWGKLKNYAEQCHYVKEHGIILCRNCITVHNQAFSDDGNFSPGDE